MQTRMATLQDADCLYPLVCAAHGSPIDRAVFDGIFSAALASKRRCIVVAAEENTLCGFAELEAQYTLAHCTMQGVLHQLYVLPEYRRKKIGTALLIFLHAKAKALGCNALQIQLPRVSITDAAFAEHNGFVRKAHIYTRPMLQ